MFGSNLIAHPSSHSTPRPSTPARDSRLSLSPTPPRRTPARLPTPPLPHAQLLVSSSPLPNGRTPTVMGSGRLLAACLDQGPQASTNPSRRQLGQPLSAAATAPSPSRLWWRCPVHPIAMVAPSSYGDINQDRYSYGPKSSASHLPTTGSVAPPPPPAATLPARVRLTRALSSASAFSSAPPPASVVAHPMA